MPLGLGLGLGLQKPTLPTVSAWPTIADIPQGAVVLDVDGVVKQCVYVFRNAGTDYVNLGRHSHLINLLNPTNTYKVCIIGNISDVFTAQVLLAIGGTTTAEKQIQVAVVGGYLEAIIGGVLCSRVSISAYSGQTIKAELTKYATDAQLVVNDARIGTRLATGTNTNATNLYIGGRTDGSSANFEGDVFNVVFAAENGDFVDAFDPNRDDLWDGSQTGYTVMGYPFAVTDGTPAGCRVKTLVPVSLL